MIFDIVVIVLCVLFLLDGLRRGFMRSVISLMGVLVTLLVTVFLAKPFADFLTGFIPFHTWIGDPILTKFSTINAMTVTVPATLVEFTSALTGAGFPGFISNLIAPSLFSAIPEGVQGYTLAQVVAPFVTNLIVVAIAGVILFILIRIALAILEHFAKKLTNIQFVKVVDKSLGMVIGAAKGFIVVLFLMTILALMMNLSFMSPVKAQLEKSTVSKFLYENNFIAKFIFGKIAGDTEIPPLDDEEKVEPSPDVSPDTSPDQTTAPEENEKVLYWHDKILIRNKIYKLV